MRVLLTSWGSRGDIEPLAGLAVALRELGGQATVCAPPDDDFVALLARAAVPMVPLGPSVRSVVAKPPTAHDAFQLAPQLVAARFETLMAAANGCDALLATGLMPAGARDVADKLGIRYVLACSSHAPNDVARIAIESARVQGRRVVLARGWAGLTAIDDADDCFVVGEVNQQVLFGRMAAVVHHGGAGTTHTAARAGAPQVIVPQIADQPSWAARVAKLGIGVAHDGPTPTTDSMSAALSAVLTPEMQERARNVASTIRSDGATVAAKMLLDGGS